MSRSDLRIRVVGPTGAPLSRSRFIDEYVPTRTRQCNAPLGEEIVADADLRQRLEGTIIYADDDTPRVIADSPLDIVEKCRILPTRHPEGLAMPGSKVGLARTCAAAGVPMPRSIVATDPEDLERAVASIGTPCLVKDDLGGGGAGITVVTSGSDLADVALDRPVVVQEFVDGTEVSVEILCRDGRVMGWQYAEVVGLTGRFGPSTARRYRTPGGRDFVVALGRLADHAGLHGFFNCSFLRTPEGDHLLIEADPRPNAWHQFGPMLGLDWTALLFDDPPIAEPRTVVTPVDGRSLHLYPRQLSSGLADRDWGALRPWLSRAPGTWDTRNTRDRAVSRAEHRQLTFPALQRVWRSLPLGLTESPPALRAKARALSAFGIPWTPPGPHSRRVTTRVGSDHTRGE